LSFVRRWELLLVALVAPLLAFPPLGRGLLWIVLAIPALWLVAAAAGEALPPTPLNGALLALAAAVLLSLTATADLLFSAPKVLGVALGFAVFFALVRRLRDGAFLDLAVDLYVAAGAALAALGLLGTNWIGKMPLLARITSRLPAVIRGVPGQAEGFQPNAIAGALLFFLPLQFALVVAGKRSRRIAYAALFAFSFAVFFLTQSRNALLSLGVAAAAWALWQSRGTRRRKVIIAVAASVVVAVLALAFARAIVVRNVGRGVGSDISQRVELWSRAAMMARDFPLTGVGMNQFRRALPAMYPSWFEEEGSDTPHPHNMLFTVVAEMGAPGLIAYLALWLGIAAVIFDAVVTTRDRRTRWLAGGFGAAFLASFGFGMGDAIALGAKVGIVFWMAMALAVVLRDRAHAEAA